MVEALGGGLDRRMREKREGGREGEKESSGGSGIRGRDPSGKKIYGGGRKVGMWLVGI